MQNQVRGMAVKTFALGCLLASVTLVAGKKAVCTTGQADIVFLLDSSGSVGYENFQTELSFVSTFVQGFPVGPDAVQFSLVLFSTEVNRQFNLNDYQTQGDLVNVINNAHYEEGLTRTAKALSDVRNKSYQPASGGRDGVPKILIVVTDGISFRPLSTAREASFLHQDGVLVITVGVGDKVKMKELRAMASNDSLVFNVLDFDGLNNILNDLQTATCVQMTEIETCEYTAVPTPYRTSGQVNQCDWPSVARVVLGSGNDRSLMCGGVLVGRNKVITTASCVDRPGAHSVIFGGDDTTSQDIRVSSISIHPYYNEKDNDIAVLRLARVVDYDDCVRPACLPPPREACDDITMETCLFTGWSLNRGINFDQQDFHVGSSAYLSPKLCSLLYKYGRNVAVPANTVCIDTFGHSVHPTSDDEGGTVSCMVNGTLLLQSLINVPSNSDYPSFGVDLRNPDILHFIKEH